MSTASDSTWQRFLSAVNQDNCCLIRRYCGTSNPTPTSREPSSLPKPGTQPGFIRSVALSATVGRNGMGGFEMMSGVFFAQKRILLGALLTAYLVARQFTATKDAKLNKVLIL